MYPDAFKYLYSTGIAMGAVTSPPISAAKSEPTPGAILGAEEAPKKVALKTLVQETVSPVFSMIENGIVCASVPIPHGSGRADDHEFGD